MSFCTKFKSASRSSSSRLRSSVDLGPRVQVVRRVVWFVLEGEVGVMNGGLCYLPTLTTSECFTGKVRNSPSTEMIHLNFRYHNIYFIGLVLY